METENPDLYSIGNVWKFDNLFDDYQNRTLTDEERQELDRRHSGDVNF